MYGWGVGIGRGENSYYLDPKTRRQLLEDDKKWLMFTKYFALFQASYILFISSSPTTCEMGALSFPFIDEELEVKATM